MTASGAVMGPMTAPMMISMVSRALTFCRGHFDVADYRRDHEMDSCTTPPVRVSGTFCCPMASDGSLAD